MSTFFNKEIPLKSTPLTRILVPLLGYLSLPLEALPSTWSGVQLPLAPLLPIRIAYMNNLPCQLKLKKEEVHSVMVWGDNEESNFGKKFHKINPKGSAKLL